MNLKRRKEFMRKITFKNAILLILIVSLLSIGLTSCVDIVVPGNTGTVKLVVSGNNEYYLYMDDHPIIVDNSYAVPEGTYILYNVSAGDHDFEAVDTRGQNFGYDSKTKFISAGTTTTVYLNPTPTITTGTLQITIANDYWPYRVYMDGSASTGTYLGTTEWGVEDLIDSQGTFYNIPTGYHSFYVISTDYEYDGWGYKTINPGMNYLEIYT
jgi:hypothetical protein